MKNAWRLDGQLALITGASKGLGAAMAREFASLGCDLVLNARGREGLETLAESIRDKNPSCRIELVVSDLADEQGRDRVVETIADKGISHQQNM